MKLYSIKNPSHIVDLKTAVLQSLSPDGGLYMPTEIPKFPPEFFHQNLTFQEIAFQVAKKLIGSDVSEDVLKEIVYDSVNFDAPVVHLKENIYALELFHGPTLAFKDFGARFMSRLTRHFEKGQITVLVATSGDTGSAVAQGFYKIPNTKVILLYPSGKVSHIQEQQLTTLGENIHALEVDGTFDDCQRMVKEAFLDPDLHLTSANSINIARLIPQTFYYFYAYFQLKKPLVFSVPSGNFGNLTAGLIAQKMGLPVEKFIAAVNTNETFPEYLRTGEFKPKPSVKTISNAMDVGNPSNFPRVLKLNENDILSASFSDQQTKEAILEIAPYYTLDPHGAVAYLGLKKFLKPNQTGVLLETAHPAKFADILEPILNKKIEIPERLKSCLKKEKKSVKIRPEFEDLKKFLKTVK